MSALQASVCGAGSSDLDEQGLTGSGEEMNGLVASSEEHLLTGHTGAVVCCAMHEDRLLFTGSTDCTIKVHTSVPCHLLTLRPTSSKYISQHVSPSAHFPG